MTLKEWLKAAEVKSEVETTRWINDDIKPIEYSRRTWGPWTFHNYWILINANISTYLTGSALIPLGLNWWQAVICIILGNLIATLYIVVNSIPGAYYHIGFPVANRYVWGMYGSQFVIWNRILLSLVWFVLLWKPCSIMYGFQAWMGGECFYIIMMSLDPLLEKHVPNTMAANTGVTTAQFLAYIMFSLISLPFIWIRPHKLEKFMMASGIIVVVFMTVLLIWALATMGPLGFGSTITDTNVLQGESSTVGWLMIYGIISTIGSIAAGILNQNDMARFSRKPRDAITGQVISFPFYGSISAIIGILVTAATQQRFGSALWNLPDIFTTLIERGGSRERAAGFFAGLALVVSQIGVNVPGNALAGGCDLSATFPRYINIRRGAYLTALFSIAVNPWKLVSTSTTFLSVLSSYSVFLGPTVGMMISSYFVVNRCKINVDDLFLGNSQSTYWFTYGVDWRAIIAWIFGVFPSFPGFLASVSPGIRVTVGWTHLYDLCFISGSCIAAFVYILLHYIFPAPKLQAFLKNSASPKELMVKYQDSWDSHLSSTVVGGETEEDKVSHATEIKKY
ncbi:NCS1 nucleoside transporter family protein-2 [Coleophoma crateriformis]|uniref:NCS1 nucleoside transporter family protein-2 n=1 Tax=Coleophoma crateriformis TaxID=565419 RepID=A0A3D8SAR1_9HELO|nr:NCS1 nucleoside transporter family protein-2 [Coleophoma crateriformis]